MGLLGKNKKTKKKKAFRPLDIVLFTFSAVFVLDSLGLSLTIGWASIIWWIVLAAAFFLPYGMITAELTTTFPEGGIYNWVVRGLGIKNGARSNFFYWINVAFWMPSVYLALGSTLVSSFDKNIVNESWFIWVNMGIAIVATWITWAVNKIDLDKAKWLPSLGSFIKGFLVIMMLVSMIVFLALGNPVQTGILGNDVIVDGAVTATGVGSILPDFAAPFGVVGIIVYNMCGFELSANLGDDVKEVKKTIPKSLFIGGVTIISAYVIASIPAFITLNVSDPAFQDGGYVNSIVNVFYAGLPPWLVGVLGILLAFTLLTNMLSWTLGSNRAIAEAAEAGEMPKSFAKTNKYKCPTYASTVLSIISTVAIIIGSVMQYVGAGQAYFILFSFSLILFFLPYIMIFKSYLKLKVLEPNLDRPFAVRNKYLSKLCGYLALTLIIIACITQVLDITFADGGIQIAPVGDFGTGGAAWGALAGTVGGIIACIIAGDLMIWWARKQSGSNDPTQYDLNINKDIIIDKPKKTNSKANLNKIVAHKVNINSILFDKKINIRKTL